MTPSRFSPHTWLLICVIVAILAFAAASALRGNADVLASLPFDSPAQPTTQPSATTRPTRTPRATATSDLGAFISPLSTPTPFARAPLTLNAKVYLPLVRKDPTPTPIKYGWKGIADAGELSSANKSNGFWGLNPDWYYNWGFGGPWAATHGTQAQNDAAIATLLDAAMADPTYVPMIWCTDDVGAGISPETAAGKASDHPGRVWLLFNEPDIVIDGDNCGTRINTYCTTEVDPPISYYGSANASALGKYLAKQYIRYYDAIKAADPTARIFPFGGIQPPGAKGNPGSIGKDIWTAFAGYLANPVDELNKTPRPLNGIAIHAYLIPESTGCGVADASCLQQALTSTHNFYQTTNPGITASKPIWITEIGNLAPGGSPAGSPQGRPTAQANTANVLAKPLLAWFIANAGPAGSVPYFNAIAWFSTHDCRYTNPSTNTIIKDFTASDLLDIGPVACPLTTQPTTQQRTVIGQAWATSTCAACACPGPDCP